MTPDTIARRSILIGATTLAATGVVAGAPLRVAKAQAEPPVLTPSPSRTRALPPGPDARAKMTEDYVRLVARDAYFWAWPLVNMYNRRLFYSKVKDFAWVGPVQAAPLNNLAMLTDYITPEERSVAISCSPARRSQRAPPPLRQWRYLTEPALKLPSPDIINLTVDPKDRKTFDLPYMHL